MMHFATHTVSVYLLAGEGSSNRNPGHLSRDKGNRWRVAKWSRKVSIAETLYRLGLAEWST